MAPCVCPFKQLFLRRQLKNKHSDVTILHWLLTARYRTVLLRSYRSTSIENWNQRTELPTSSHHQLLVLDVNNTLVHIHQSYLTNYHPLYAPPAADLITVWSQSNPHSRIFSFCTIIFGLRCASNALVQFDCASLLAEHTPTGNYPRCRPMRMATINCCQCCARTL